MSFVQCCNNNKVPDTIKVNMREVEKRMRDEEEKAQLEAEKRRREEEEEERQSQEQAQLEEQRREEDEARKRAEEVLQQQEEQERQERQEQERQEAERLQKEREQEEQARLRREQEAAARRAEEEQRKEEERQREETVNEFLKESGFKGGVDEPKRSCCSQTYPLHVAAAQGKVDVVRGLLAMRADPAQRNSAKKTAEELAKQRNKQDSHASVLEALNANDQERQLVNGAC